MKTKEAADEWIFATEKMQKKVLVSVLFRDQIKDRDCRIRFFKAFRKDYRDFLVEYKAKNEGADDGENKS